MAKLKVNELKELKVNERLAGSQWINIMLAVCLLLPIVVRVCLLFGGWRPMVDTTHAVFILGTYISCIGWPLGAVIFADRKKSKMDVFKFALYKGMFVNSLILTTGRLHLSHGGQENIFCNDLFKQHQLPRWVFAMCILSNVFSTWYKFKKALLLNAAQIVPLVYGCIIAQPTGSEERGRMFVEVMALCIVSLVLLYNSWRGHNAIVSAALASQLLQLEQQRTRRLAAQRRGDRLMNHHVKNVMAEVFASLMLYTDSFGVTVADLRDAGSSLKRAIVFLQKTLAIASIFDRSIATETAEKKSPDIPKQVVGLQDWVTQFAPKDAIIEGCSDECFVFSDSIVADLFADLSFGNCVKHGGGDVRVTCTFEPEPVPPGSDPTKNGQRLPRGILRMDIHNLIKGDSEPEPGNLRDMQQQLGNFSNGLGLGDMTDVCQRRNVPYRTFAEDNRWHSTIALKARVAVATPTAQSSCPPLPSDLHVVIVDDQKMILRMAAALLRKRFEGIRVSTYRLNTVATYDEFCRTAVHSCKTWNIFIVDQHFAMEGEGCIRHGTDLLKMVLDAGYQGCLVMHSGNNTGSDIATYSACGAHGTVGKGAQNFANELERIYDNFLFDRKRSMRKRSYTETNSEANADANSEANAKPNAEANAMRKRSYTEANSEANAEANTEANAKPKPIKRARLDTPVQ